MPWTLYRYILKELLKLMVVSAVVLVSIISVFAAIKPLSEGLLTPFAVLKFVAYTAPTMLGFALPFAAAFASTLVFVRMNSDREIVACSTSGMGYGMILLPVVVLGLALAVGMFALSNLVVPAFYRQAEATLQRDVMSLLVNQLNRNEPFELGDMVLYADRAIEAEPPELENAPLKPLRLVQLRGVAVGELDDDGTLRSDTTARLANVLLFRDPETRRSWITLRVRDVVYSREGVGRGDLFAVDRLDPWSIPMPSPLRDSTKFMSWPQLRDLGQDPQRYDEVAHRREALARAMAVWTLRQRLLEPLAAGQAVTLEGALPGDRFTLEAGRVRAEDDRLVLTATPGEAVTLVEYRGDEPRRRIEAAAAAVELDAEEPAPEPVARVTLVRARVIDARRDMATEHGELTLPAMVRDETILAGELDAMSPLELRDTVARKAEASPPPVSVERALRELGREIHKLAMRIIAELNTRAASAVSAGLVLLLGAVTSLNQRGAMPLVIYFRVFLAAVLAVLLVAGGENLAVNRQLPLGPSLAILWSGNLLLLLGIAWAYALASRH